MDQYKLSESYCKHSDADYGELFIARSEEEYDINQVHIKLTKLSKYIQGSDPCALSLDDAEWIRLSIALGLNPDDDMYTFYIDTVSFTLSGIYSRTLRINHPDFFPEIHNCCRLLFSDLLQQYFAPRPTIYAFESKSDSDLTNIRSLNRVINKYPETIYECEHVWRVTKFSLFTSFEHPGAEEMYAHDRAIKNFCIAWCQPGNKYECQSAKSLATNPLFESKLLTSILQFLTISKETTQLLASNADVYTLKSNLEGHFTSVKNHIANKKAHHRPTPADVDDNDDTTDDTIDDTLSDSDDELYESGLQLIPQDRKSEDYPPDQLVFLTNLTCIAEPIIMITINELKNFATLKLSELMNSSSFAIEVLSFPTSYFLVLGGRIYLYKPTRKELEKYVYHPAATAYIHIRELIRQLQL